MSLRKKELKHLGLSFKKKKKSEIGNEQKKIRWM